MKRSVLEAKITDVQKRRYPSKHYVYVIHVTWSDGTINVLYRRYNAFFEMQCRLLDSFPEEGGATNPRDRMIPFLPGKILFRRSEVYDVAVKRMTALDEYCGRLIKLPPKISECEEVLTFFEPTADDINPPAIMSVKTTKGEQISSPMALEQYTAVTDYKKVYKEEISLKAGMMVEVIEKKETGWWYISVDGEKGWVPGNYLIKDGFDQGHRESFSSGVEHYIAVQPYMAARQDEITFEKGAIVTVIEKNFHGWWRVSYNGMDGLAPATYLQKVHDDLHKRTNELSPLQPIQIVSNVMELSRLMKEEQERKAASPVAQPRPTRRRSSLGIIFKPKRSRSITSQKSLDAPDNMANKLLNAKNVQTNTNRSVSVGNLLEKAQLKNTTPTLGYHAQRQQRSDFSSSSSSSDAMQSCGSSGTLQSPAGSLPSFETVIKKPPPRPKTHPVPFQYVTIADFVDTVGDGISFKQGEIVKVFETNVSGWWYVQIGDREGWAPSTYIERKVIGKTADDVHRQANFQLSTNKVQAENWTVQDTSFDDSGIVAGSYPIYSDVADDNAGRLWGNVYDDVEPDRGIPDGTFHQDIQSPSMTTSENVYELVDPDLMDAYRAPPDGAIEPDASCQNKLKDSSSSRILSDAASSKQSDRSLQSSKKSNESLSVISSGTTFLESPPKSSTSYTISKDSNMPQSSPSYTIGNNSVTPTSSPSYTISKDVTATENIYEEVQEKESPVSLAKPEMIDLSSGKSTTVPKSATDSNKWKPPRPKPPSNFSSGKKFGFSPATLFDSPAQKNILATNTDSQDPASSTKSSRHPFKKDPVPCVDDIKTNDSKELSIEKTLAKHEESAAGTSDKFGNTKAVSKEVKLKESLASSPDVTSTTDTQDAKPQENKIPVPKTRQKVPSESSSIISKQETSSKIPKPAPRVTAKPLLLVRPSVPSKPRKLTSAYFTNLRTKSSTAFSGPLKPICPSRPEKQEESESLPKSPSLSNSEPTPRQREFNFPQAEAPQTPPPVELRSHGDRNPNVWVQQRRRSSNWRPVESPPPPPSDVSHTKKGSQPPEKQVKARPRVSAVRPNVSPPPPPVRTPDSDNTEKGANDDSMVKALKSKFESCQS